MKILLVHNRYQQYGGEDATFDSEKELLKKYGHAVKSLVFDNNEIIGLKAKLKLAYELIYNKRSERLMNTVIHNFEPDIIHVHNFFYLASPSIFFSAKNNNIPIIATLQNYRLICAGGLLMRNSQPCELCIQKKFPSYGIRYKCHRNSKVQSAHLIMATGIHKLMDTWNKKVTRYIAVTEFGREKYINSSLRLSPDRIVVKPSSVDDTEIYPYEERQDYFLFIGRLSKEKGIEVLLKAFDSSDLRLEIIGDGPLKPLVEETASFNQNIQFSGYRDKNYIISRLKKCRAMVFPSVWYECLPITILEAFSTGTPVIISNGGNLNEIVSDGYNGIHFKTNDVPALKNTLQNFHLQHFSLQHLYQNARKTYTEKYTHETNYNNLINIYQTAINEYER
ncbi:MAG: glycosyltransferase family 4 protein [Cyclobacteriaceae bacterium]